MNKYIIEGGLDFYEELYKSLDIEETNEKTEEDNNLCLITNQILVENFVQLNCGHKFNYSPLFLDIKNHRQKFNGMEGSSSKLAIDEIRCPYCRTKQKGVLPYYEDLGFPKINGVNIINLSSTGSTHSYSCYKPCEYVKLNPYFDPSGNDPVEKNKINKGNCKFHICFSSGTQLGYGSENYGDEKYYCWSHKKEMMKKYKQEIKNKAKEEASKEKLKLKEETKKAKEEAKLKEKEDKKKAKEEAKKSHQNTSQENIVLGHIDMSGNNVTIGCIEILKSGQNKGNPCGCKIILDDLCNRHFKIKNGIMKNI
jgi:hypothetical protein